ncbi:DEAD-domain-containing protein [Thozetella sp. PMI_491]|nr:DEAD-domain-containing protein [Thozetella sp. PMI_491]
MADDGMLLNFELGDAPLKTQVKFKGGRWRDRVRAQKSAKRSHDATPPSKSSAGGRRGPLEDVDVDSNRPNKKRRTEHGSTPDARNGPSRLHPGIKTGQVGSRLFTSNPTATTSFDEKPAEEAEPVNPSNAPLSEEAENFLALGLSRRIAQHLSAKLEMKAPTSIQKNTIPSLVKEDHDAFLQAETGSGKTLAYLLPIVQRIMSLSLNEDGTSKETKVHRNSGLFAIILAPTRELCKQIATVLEKLLRCASWLVSTTVIGGESKKSEKARLRKGVNILIATPGRLTDHLDNTKVLDVGTARWLVLDEGDRMMEMGFEDDIKTIVGKIRKDPLKKTNSEGVALDGILPSRRVTVLCSATMKMNVQKLGEISLQEAVHITATKAESENDAANEAVFAAPSQLKQSYIVAPAKLRLVSLIALLKSSFARKGSVMKAIIFISCADSVDFYFDLLQSTKPAEPTSLEPTDAAKTTTHTESTVAKAAYVTSPANPTIMVHKLHGSLSQPVRTATLRSFTLCKDPAVLITTDISSRGLDVPEVDLVIEYDPAFAVADHVHRIGRTARAGRPGKAILFLLPGCEEGYVTLLGPSSTLTPQSSDAVLQKGLLTPVELPGPASSGPSDSDNAASNQGKQSWRDRAEALQLHIEQRLLAAPPADEAPEKPEKPKSSFKTSKGQNNSQAKKENPLLEAGRKGFRSHIRAYATHVKEERGYFDMTQLHLGHVAKSFGLREAPGGIGGGVSRRTHKVPAQKAGAGKRATRGMDDDDDAHNDGANEEAARRMRERMKAVMNSSNEFNIG